MKRRWLRGLARIVLMFGLSGAGVAMIEVAPAEACVVDCYEELQKQRESCGELYESCRARGGTTTECEALYRSCIDYAEENYRVCEATGVIPPLPPWILPP